MSFFQVDHNQASEGGIIPEGKYEVIVARAYEDASKSGTMGIHFNLVVRNDIVGQAHANRYIFSTIWQSKQTGQYHSGMLNSIAKALRIENGKRYNSLEELLDDFINKTAKVTVKHEEYNGQVNARVKSWEPSNFQGCNHTFNQKDNGIPEGFHPADNDDIPF